MAISEVHRCFLEVDLRVVRRLGLLYMQSLHMLPTVPVPSCKPCMHLTTTVKTNSIHLLPWLPGVASARSIHGFLNNNRSHCWGAHIVIQSRRNAIAAAVLRRPQAVAESGSRPGRQTGGSGGVRSASRGRPVAVADSGSRLGADWWQWRSQARVQGETGEQTPIPGGLPYFLIGAPGFQHRAEIGSPKSRSVLQCGTFPVWPPPSAFSRVLIMFWPWKVVAFLNPTLVTAKRRCTYCKRWGVMIN